MSNTFDLKHKIRKVSDLVRFIANTSVENVLENEKMKVGNPNFSILLGAGASISSGIQSGGQLVKKWKEDVYADIEDKKGTTSEDEYFMSHKPEWYDEANPYSSLFEHRYDLQRQRRIFVEKEVAGKTPSIGYAYLVKLIAAGYFNTVFTTNFDDLLNEAFYRFSHVRPVVCAHDSSISGVTITSDRPKIIKLHGDYLFDNIKTTLRETESLETNMRMKFQEFAKDYGLIVVGYSGQDRSIMDILNYLIQHDEYLKNGIYWCIVKNDLDRLTGELKKFLWKDRVYIVEIDGFDEMMAEINLRLTNDPLPIQTDLMNRRFQERIINDLADNEFIKETTSSYLQKGLESLKQTYQAESKKDILEFVKNTRDEDTKLSNRVKQRPELRDPYPAMSKEQRLSIEEMYDKIGFLNKEMEVLGQLQSMNILSLPASRYKIELIELYLQLNKRLTDNELMQYFNDLIELEPRNKSNYIWAVNRLMGDKHIQEYYEKAIAAFRTDSYLYGAYARFLINSIEGLASPSNMPDTVKQTIIKLLDKSIELDGTIDNEAYCLKAKFYKIIYSNQLDRRKVEWENINKMIASKKLDVHPNYLNLQTIMEKGELADKYKKAIEFYQTADNAIMLEDCVIQYIQYLSKRDKQFEEIRKVYEDFSRYYSPSRDLVKEMAKQYKRYEYFDDALRLIEGLPPVPDVAVMKMQMLHYMGRDDEMVIFYNSIRKTPEIEYEYYELTGDYAEALRCAKTMSANSLIVQEADLITQSFLLLKMERYDEVVQLLNPYLVDTHSAPILLNVLFAKKKRGDDSGKIKQQIEEKVLHRQYVECSDLEKVAAYAILEKKSEVISYLTKVIKKEPIEKYNISRWPIMSAYSEDTSIQCLYAPNLHKNKHEEDSNK